ncbi:MAG: hypothetical protein NC311_12450 [Muribaculaceae bacterium]|nr:hypothetical protein [Muribaculaceae bacterium]
MAQKTDAGQFSKPEQVFLDLFRSLETACREEGNMQVLDLERHLDSRSRPQDVSKLRACRIIRNYLVHDGAGFVTVTPAMSRFLDQLIKEVRAAKGTAKDVMTTIARYGSAGPDDKAADAAATMLSKKRDSLVLTGPDGLYGGVLDAAGLAMCLSDKKIATVKQLLARKGARTDVLTVGHDTPVSALPAGRAVVLKNGRPAGVINISEAWETC